MTDPALHPTSGARYLFERAAGADEQGQSASYRVAIYTPDAVFAAPAAIFEDGRVELGSTGAPVELESRLLTMARLLARDAARRREDGLPAWPARVLRWRA